MMYSATNLSNNSWRRLSDLVFHQITSCTCSIQVAEASKSKEKIEITFIFRCTYILITIMHHCHGKLLKLFQVYQLAGSP